MKDLVCLHAAASSPATWDHLKPALADLGYRVHTPTLLGHQRTAHDDPPSNQRGSALVLRAMALLNGGRFNPAMLRQTVAELRKPHPHWWTALPTITAPTLLLAGGPTSHLDQERFELVAEELPASTLTTVEAGHRIHSKAPGQWMATVAAFLG